jgi:hypothetical protein
MPLPLGGLDRSWAFFWDTLCPASHKRLEWDLCPFKTVSVVSHCKKEVRVCSQLSLLGMLINLMSEKLQRWLGSSWNPVGVGSRLTVVVTLTGGPPIGKQRWVGSKVPTGCRRLHLLSPSTRIRLSQLVSGQQGVWVRNHRVQSHCCLIDCLEILHRVAIIGVWLLKWQQGSVLGRLTRSQDSIFKVSGRDEISFWSPHWQKQARFLTQCC